MTFHDFDFDARLVEGLDAMGFSTPTPIQREAIPVILSGKDVVGCAQTGTGKTAAYVLPLLHRIVHTETRHLNTLILAPTRELALQIDQQIEGLGYFLGVSSIAVYGGGDGAAWDQQRKALESGVDVIIATPGRLIALLATGTLNMSHLRHLVLDEADRMLDMGFYDDIMKIIRQLPTDRQTLLFSATMPPKIRTLADRILRAPVEVKLAISKPAAGITQQAYLVYDKQKVSLIKHIMHHDDHGSVIIFASTRDSVKKLNQALKEEGLSAKAFHSDLDQKEREDIMRQFKSREVRIIIGTDILSRGIDVDGIGLVINYDVPPDAEDYVHRIGRTARADNTGTAITFINEKDQERFHTIERLIEQEVPKVPLPSFLGQGPEYDPSRRVPESHGNNRRKGSSFKRRKGNHQRRQRRS